MSVVELHSALDERGLPTDGLEPALVARLAAALAAAGPPPTPLSLARALRAAGDADYDSAAHLVLRASQPWRPQTHALFPAAARARAVELMRLGRLLSNQPRFADVRSAAVGLNDVWMSIVVPHAVGRGYAPPVSNEALLARCAEQDLGALLALVAGKMAIGEAPLREELVALLAG